MNQTHPKRQKKLFDALNELNVNYQSCARCNAYEEDPLDLHNIIQTQESLHVLLDEETQEDRRNAGTITFGGRSRIFNLAHIVCKRCGFTTEFNLEILEQHL